MNAPLYTVEILRLAASLPEPATLDRVDGRAEARSPTCGSTVSAEVAVDPEGRVEAVSLEVEACAFGQASAAIVAGQSAGRTANDLADALNQLESWLSGRIETPPDWPGLQSLSPARARKARHGAIMLPFRALVAAMESARG